MLRAWKTCGKIRHVLLDGRESEWTPGVSDGQGGLACCDSWGHKESDTTKRLKWTELKITADGDHSHEIKSHLLLGRKIMTNLDSIPKSRDYFAHKGPTSQSYGFSSSHVWMWELDYKERWAPKNWCFWTVVLEKILESPLDRKGTQPVHPKGDQTWIFIGRIDANAETPKLWPPDMKNWLIGKDPDAGKDWRQEMLGSPSHVHHWLNGEEFE